MKEEKELFDRIYKINEAIDILSNKAGTPGINKTILRNDIEKLQKERRILTWVIN